MIYSVIHSSGEIHSQDGEFDADIINLHTEGWFDVVTTTLPDETVLVGYVHDEGHLIGLELNAVASAIFGRVLAGNVVICCGTNRMGEYDGESYSLSPRQLAHIYSVREPIRFRPSPLPA